MMQARESDGQMAEGRELSWLSAGQADIRQPCTEKRSTSERAEEGLQNTLKVIHDLAEAAGCARFRQESPLRDLERSANELDGTLTLLLPRPFSDERSYVCCISCPTRLQFASPSISPDLRPSPSRSVFLQDPLVSDLNLYQRCS